MGADVVNRHNVRVVEHPGGARFEDFRGYGYLAGPDDPRPFDKLDKTTKSITAGGFLQDSWNIADSSSNPSPDWASFFDATGAQLPLPLHFMASDFVRDFVPNATGPDFTTFTTGSKDTLPIGTGWQCARSSNVNSKVDLLNTYATFFVDPDARPGDYLEMRAELNCLIAISTCPGRSSGPQPHTVHFEIYDPDP